MPREPPTGPEFDVLFLGTGAADYDWARYGRPGVRGSCAALLDGRILLDCGPTVPRAFPRCGADPRALREVWFTHSHGDHCNPAAVASLLAARGPRAAPLRLRGTPPLLARLRAALPARPGGRFETVPFAPLAPFRARGWRVVPLPANHATEDPAETPVHFFVRGRRRNLLYALDGAWITTAARRALGRTRLDLLVWDATLRASGDGRLFEHNDLGMVRTLAARLAADGVLGPASVQILDHLSREHWRGVRRAPAPFLLARDGLRLRV